MKCVPLMSHTIIIIICMHQYSNIHIDLKKKCMKNEIHHHNLSLKTNTCIIKQNETTSKRDKPGTVLVG